jgi:hypothetical protein
MKEKRREREESLRRWESSVISSREVRTGRLQAKLKIAKMVGTQSSIQAQPEYSDIK